MSDFVDRQAAIKELNNEIIRRRLFDNANDGMLDEFDTESILRNLPSAQPEQRWIPTSERLPKVREWVLCQCRAGIMDVLRLTEDGDWNKNYPHAEYMSCFVIAWMPLPEPYRKGTEDAV